VNFRQCRARRLAPCAGPAYARYTGLRGWRGRVPRQPGQVRKEAAPTRPSRVVASLSPSHTFSVGAFAVHGLDRYILPMADALFPESEMSPPAVAGKTPYLVLARKYRPSSFSTLIGQDAMVQTLRNAFRSNRIP